MTKEDKMLLIKDLSARLPYAVIVEHTSGFRGTLHDLTAVHLYNEDDIKDIDCGVHFFGDEDWFSVECFKPYLFPLSSMTEEQFNELKYFAELNYETDTLELVEWENNYKTLEFWLEEVPSYCVIKVFDWLNKNHFDYRGLIPKGLALDATGQNIY